MDEEMGLDYETHTIDHEIYTTVTTMRLNNYTKKYYQDCIRMEDDLNETRVLEK